MLSDRRFDDEPSEPAPASDADDTNGSPQPPKPHLSKYEASDNWGEAHDDQRQPRIFVLNWQTQTIEEPLAVSAPAHLSSPDINTGASPCLLRFQSLSALSQVYAQGSCGQAVWHPTKLAFAFVAWSHGIGRRLALAYCLNRDSRYGMHHRGMIFCRMSFLVVFLQHLLCGHVRHGHDSRAHQQPQPRRPLAAGEVLSDEGSGLFCPSYCLPPQFSPDGATLAWLENDVGGPHASASGLVACRLGQTPEVIVAIDGKAPCGPAAHCAVNNIELSSHLQAPLALYALQFPQRCWLSVSAFGKSRILVHISRTAFHRRPSRKNLSSTPNPA